MNNEKQLTLFQNNEIAVIPKSRQREIAKVAKNHGIEAAHTRAMLFESYDPMRKAVEAQYKRRGETKGPGGKIIGLNTQLKKAVGASMKECSPSQMGLALAIRESFTNIINSCDGGAEESDKRKAVVEAAIDFRTKLERIAA